MMTRWCLYLRHGSSGAYETLCSSGILKLPSQHTLRDYTYFVKGAPGLSKEVEMLLMEAARVDCCEEYEKCTLLLLDVMHIHNNLVYDKHELVTFCISFLGSKLFLG